MKPYLEVFLIKVTVILPDLLPLRLAPPSRWLISCLLFIFSIFQETAFSPHPHAPAGISSCDQRVYHLRSQVWELKREWPMTRPITFSKKELPLYRMRSWWWVRETGKSNQACDLSTPPPCPPGGLSSFQQLPFYQFPRSILSLANKYVLRPYCVPVSLLDA